MARVYLMCGLPFSGKTTLSKAIAEFLQIPRISFDETWIEIEKEKGRVPGDSDLNQWIYVNTVCEQSMTAHLKNGTSVVYDNLGHSSFERSKIRDIANSVGSLVQVIYLATSKEEVIIRRRENLETNQRSQVSDENFIRGLRNFEVPDKSETVLVYESSVKIDTWLQLIFANN